MDIQITSEIEELVHSIYAGGNYPNETAVLGQALALLKQRDQLRRDVQAGVAQLEAGQRLAGDDVFRKLEDKAQRIQRQAQGGA